MCAVKAVPDNLRRRRVRVGNSRVQSREVSVSYCVSQLFFPHKMDQWG